MRYKCTLVLAATLAVTNVAAGQSVMKILSEDFRNAGKDVVSIWGSPFDASGRDWLLTGLAFGAFGASMVVDESVADWASLQDSAAFFRAISPVRRGGVLFKGKYVVPPLAAAYVLGVALKNQDMRDAVLGCMATWTAQSPLRKGVYRLVGRARPRGRDLDTLRHGSQEWSIPGGSAWDMHSFPAGHFANVLGCATYWNERFRLGTIEPALYALAAAVGVGRLVDEAHWMSDTVLGGILGYAVGREIARRSLAREDVRALNSSSLYLSPDQGGVTLGLRWTF